MSVAKFCLVLFLIYSAWFLTKIKFSNEVPFSGDVWEYQSMAVNLVKGGGLMKSGGVYGDYHDVYKFSQKIEEVNRSSFNTFLDYGSTNKQYSSYRTPGYIIFLAAIYKVFGTNPAIAKQVQLLLVTFIAASLPYVGWVFWKKPGTLAGLLAGFAYLAAYARSVPLDFSVSSPGDIMAETLISFSLMIFILVFIFWQKQKLPWRALLLGLTTGICILIKGTNVFLPLLLSIYLWPKKINLAAFILGVVITVLPWSVYASKVSGQTIIISSQLEPALLDNNNEYSINAGWHPEGYSLAKTGSYYLQPQVKALSLPAKLAIFYFSHWQSMPRIFLEKIRLGFGGYVYLTFFLFFLAAKAVGAVFPKIITGLALLAIAEIIYLHHYPLIFSISGPSFRVDLLLPAVLGFTLIVAWFKKKALKLDLPAVLIILFLNYLLLTLVILGWPRLNQVIDFVFMLVFFKYLLDFARILIHAV